MGELSKTSIKLCEKAYNLEGFLKDSLRDVFFPLHDYQRLLGDDEESLFE